MTNAPTQNGRGALNTRLASSSCVGRRGNPGPSTDFSVTDGLRWNRVKSSATPADQPKRAITFCPRACVSAGRHAARWRHSAHARAVMSVRVEQRGRADQAGVTAELGGHHPQAAQEVQAGVSAQRLAQRVEQQRSRLRHPAADRRRGRGRTPHPPTRSSRRQRLAPRRKARSATVIARGGRLGQLLRVGLGRRVPPLLAGPLRHPRARPRSSRRSRGRRTCTARPSGSTTTWPTCPALPVRRRTARRRAPARRRRRSTPPCRAGIARPRPAPRHCSPSAMHRPSPPSRTGAPGPVRRPARRSESVATQ